jgi:hypothetical protein
MNLGQIYETILGWAGKKMGVKFATPIFDGATVEEIGQYCSDSGIPSMGHTYLYDGETGERFHQKATVGVIYIIKLHTWLMIRCMPVQSDHTLLSHNNHSAVKHSSVVSVLVRWRFGHLKLTVQQTFYRITYT